MLLTCEGNSKELVVATADESGVDTIRGAAGGGRLQIAEVMEDSGFSSEVGNSIVNRSVTRHDICLKRFTLPVVRKRDCRVTRLEAEKQLGGSSTCMLFCGVTAVASCRIAKGISYNSFTKVIPGMPLTWSFFKDLSFSRNVLSSEQN